MIRADLHVHTCYSMDCNTPLEKIIDRCLKIGIDCIAVADHNTIEGALKLKEMAPFKIIIAEEIMTSIGELMGLFLTKEVPQGLSPEETVAQIKSQGGLVSIPHPFGRAFLSLPVPRLRHRQPFAPCHSEGAKQPKNLTQDKLREESRSPQGRLRKAISSHPGQAPPSNLLSQEIMSQVDIIEVFNSRTPLPGSSTKAWRLALKYKLPASAGSDAHTLGEIGRAYVEMPEFNSPSDFLDSLSQGKIFGRRSNPLVHFASTWRRIRKRSC